MTGAYCSLEDQTDGNDHIQSFPVIFWAFYVSPEFLRGSAKLATNKDGGESIRDSLNSLVASRVVWDLSVSDLYCCRLHILATISKPVCLRREEYDILFYAPQIYQKRKEATCRK